METGAIATVISNCERKRSLFDSEKLERVADDRNSAHLGTRTQVTQAHKGSWRCHATSVISCQVLQRHTDRWLYSALVAGKRT